MDTVFKALNCSNYCIRLLVILKSVDFYTEDLPVAVSRQSHIGSESEGDVLTKESSRLL